MKGFPKVTFMLLFFIWQMMIIDLVKISSQWMSIVMMN